MCASESNNVFIAKLISILQIMSASQENCAKK